MRRFALHAKFYYVILIENLYWAISVTAPNRYRILFQSIPFDETIFLDQKSLYTQKLTIVPLNNNNAAIDEQPARRSFFPRPPRHCNISKFDHGYDATAIKLFAFHYTPANFAIWRMCVCVRGREERQGAIPLIKRIVRSYVILRANIPIGKLNCPDFHGCFCRPFPPIPPTVPLPRPAGPTGTEIFKASTQFLNYVVSNMKRHLNINLSGFYFILMEILCFYFISYVY